MSDCLFCKIIKEEVSSEKVYEDDSVLAFRDIQPSAKEHLLFIHKDHTNNVNEISDNNPEQFTQIFTAISSYTKESGLSESGFRVTTNQGPDSGQIVFHTHFHVLGGDRLAPLGVQR